MNKTRVFAVGALIATAFLSPSPKAWSLPGTLVKTPLPPMQKTGIPPLHDNRIINLNCGNGELNKYEQCDDGNIKSGDGCSRNCFLEEEEQPEVSPHPSENEENPPQPSPFVNNIPESEEGGCALATVVSGSRSMASAWTWSFGAIFALGLRRQRRN